VSRYALGLLAVLCACTAHAQVQFRLNGCHNGKCGSGASIDLALSPSNQRSAVVAVAAMMSPNGTPIWAPAGYATPGGWVVSAMPAPLFDGAPSTGWRRRIPLAGGLCALALRNGGKAGEYAVFVGSAVVGDAGTQKLLALIREMEQSDDPVERRAASDAREKMAAIPARNEWITTFAEIQANARMVVKETCG